VRLLLDEMIGAVVAEQLRDRGHDVVAVQESDRGHLRGLDDCLLLATADDENRAVVTDNIPDFFRCHQRRIDDGLGHHGLLFFTNGSFPRHRYELFVSQMIAALERELAAHEKDDPTGWVRWLTAKR
jgi:nucleoside-diphosphate-sugar epimerase